MTEDPKTDNAGGHANDHGRPKSLKNYWITGGLITAIAVGYFFYTGGTSNTAAEQASGPTQKVHTTIDSDSGMQQAGLENTRTPQIGLSSGNDGAPTPNSPSENPDVGLDDSSS